MVIAAPSAHAAWIDAAWPLRRVIDVTWDAEHSDGEDLCYTEFYAAGRADPTGKDVRVATEDGQIIASDVLMVGPGDRVRVAFALQKNLKKYYVYWGNANPPESKLTLTYHRGMLMEMKLLAGGNAENAKQMRATWDAAKTFVGRMVVERPFIGNNLFGDQQQTITKFTGQLFAPVDGDYQFAMAADDRGSLWIDEKPVVHARGAPGDIRFNGTTHLTRGGHSMVCYNVDFGGDWKISVGWKRPDMAKVEEIDRTALGYPFPGQAGPLEELHKTLIADCSIEYLGEVWYADRYSNRYRFTSYAPKVEGATYDWDFGDGQTGHGQKVDHVYINAGVYPLKLTVHIGGNSDTRTILFPADRQFEKLAHPTTDDLATQSKLVAKYNLDNMTSNDLTCAVFMHQRAGQTEPMKAAALKLAAFKRQGDADNSYAALFEAAQSLIDHKAAADAEALWAAVPPGSNLQPKASRQRGKLLMWNLGDFGKAVQVLRDLGANDVPTRRMLGMAMVLNGSVGDGEKILRSLPEQGDPDKRAAISGAMARTIEYFIGDRDADAGDDQWDKWQSRYPDDFLLGYSVLLKARLIELHGNALAAARLAEAFAIAVPKSSYAPRLLDQASKLFAAGDAKHSQDLRAMLKQRYPEDPLSQ